MTLHVQGLSPSGAALGVADADRDAPILLPQDEVPAGTNLGDAIPVFVTLDSDDHPVATTRMPKLQLGEVAFLTVTAVTGIGAFVDWGLPKELLVPFREQTRDLAVGDRHPVGLFLDKTGRLAGTMRVSEMLRAKPAIAVDEWVAGEAWRTDPAVGLFVIVERRFVGLVPATEPHGLTRGDAAMFRVTRVRADGKFELSFRGKAHEELADDAQHVLAILSAHDLSVGDRSSPDEIRALFGLSKKAFKRAVGRLLKERAVTLDDRGCVRVTASPRS